MSLRSRLFYALKSVDALVGRPAAASLGGPRRPQPAAPRDALLLRLWGLGNLTLLAPHLAAAPAGARVRLLTLERNADFVASQLPRVECLTLPDPVSPRLLPALWSRLASLADDPPEVVVDLEQFLRLPLLAVRARCPAPTVGLDTPGQGRRPLLDRAVAHDPTRHVADTFAALLDAAGLPTAAGAGPLAPDADRLPADLPAGPGPLVVLHPGTGDHFPGRRWPAERFGALARELRRRVGARLVLTGTAGEARLVERVRRAAGDPALDLSGRLDATALVSLLDHADLLVTNDTGPLHLADAVGTRAVALYGPNTPHRYGPRHPGSRALFADLPCSPCLDDRSMKRSRCTHFACMLELPVEDVARACLEVLAAARGAAASDVRSTAPTTTPPASPASASHALPR